MGDGKNEEKLTNMAILLNDQNDKPQITMTLWSRKWHYSLKGITEC